MPLSLAGNLAARQGRCGQTDVIAPNPNLVGATLVVARLAHARQRQQGDHKGRPYRAGSRRAFSLAAL